MSRMMVTWRCLNQFWLSVASGVRRLVGVRLAEQRKSRVVFGHPSKLHMPRRPAKRTAARTRNPPAQTVRVHHYASWPGVPVVGDLTAEYTL